MLFNISWKLDRGLDWGLIAPLTPPTGYFLNCRVSFLLLLETHTALPETSGNVSENDLFTVEWKKSLPRWNPGNLSLVWCLQLLLNLWKILPFGFKGFRVDFQRGEENLLKMFFNNFWCTEITREREKESQPDRQNLLKYKQQKGELFLQVLNLKWRQK